MSIYAKYLVCYDVSSNSRRKKFSDALKDLGLVPMQGSVFYGDLKPAEVRALARTAEKLLEPTEDKCFWFACRLDPADIRACVGYANWSFDEADCHGII
ncbi:CRISPR-associated endonuclease Cas2 [uncultured Sutterella sp.]|uniref:CRISPR-associated endonuclease Cas2 n=1 Tax=uncultured Sutterella sp. TaxID=286133 RepID=UPI0025E91020|nr:CRISPR-associated endonuclease Cas2 [uncultured Sutterella sp.]